MKIIEVINYGVDTFKKNKIEDSYIIAKTLLMTALDKNQEYLIINQNDELDDIFFEKYKVYIEKIVNGTPLQYITNNQEFMKLNFFVNESVLIPQPDTEILVEEVLNISKSYKSNIRILDLCTGSGAIAISLDKNLENALIDASDISLAAIEVAKVNNKKNNANVNFIKSDLFENINDKYNIIVSNPPYIKTDEINKLSEQVKSEPIIALNGGKSGLDFYKKIIEESYKYIIPNGYLCLEIGYNQKESVENLLKKYENYSNIRCTKDLSGYNRCIVAKVTS